MGAELVTETVPQDDPVQELAARTSIVFLLTHFAACSDIFSDSVLTFRILKHRLFGHPHV
jgi:hypothetical protein